MIKKDYIRCWKAADRRELHLIRLWEETALKQRLLGALLIIFIFTLLYILMVLNLLKHIESIWKPALLYLIILAGVSFVWGAIIYEDEKNCGAADFIPESSPASGILKSIPVTIPPTLWIFWGRRGKYWRKWRFPLLS